MRPATARPAERERVRGVNGTTGHELTDGEDEANASAADKDFKPVFLKGLFRYVSFFFLSYFTTCIQCACFFLKKCGDDVDKDTRDAKDGYSSRARPHAGTV